MTDVNKTTATSKLFAKFGNIYVAELIDLRHAQKSTIEASSVIKVKLCVLIDDATRVDCRAKVKTTGNYSLLSNKLVVVVEITLFRK